MILARQGTARQQSIFGTLDLIYHGAVREIRKSHRSPLIGLLMNVVQSVVMVLAFYLMFSILGARRAAIRGDFLLYLMSGILLFMVHIKSVKAVSNAEGPTSEMMMHGPLNIIVTFASAALSELYLQVLSILVILLFYHVVFTPIEIDDPIGALGMIIAAWTSGCTVGILFAALKPWAPGAIGILNTIYMRVNMIASGKMFVANALPASMLALFDWNPLFHAIDQMRGFVFLNYNPHFSDPWYPFKVSGALLIIGILVIYQTRRFASRSWGAAR